MCPTGERCVRAVSVGTPPPPWGLQASCPPGDVPQVGGEGAVVGPMGSAHPPAGSAPRSSKAPGRRVHPCPHTSSSPTRGPDLVSGPPAWKRSHPSPPGPPLCASRVTSSPPLARTCPAGSIDASPVRPSGSVSLHTVSLSGCQRRGRGRCPVPVLSMCSVKTECWAGPPLLPGSLPTGFHRIHPLKCKHEQSPARQQAPRCPFVHRINPNLGQPLLPPGSHPPTWPVARLLV